MTSTGKVITTSNKSNIISTGINGIDFGDAPDTGAGNGPNNYSTLASNNGPQHYLVNNVEFGLFVTAESVAYPNPTATGDDLILKVQDDAPVSPLVPFVTGDTTYSFPIECYNDSGSTAIVYGWMDFNRDGIFAVNEASNFLTVPSSSTNPQVVNITFNVPAGSTFTAPDTTFIRLRITTNPLTESTTLPSGEDSRSLGIALDGEVEDFLVNIVDPTISGSVWYDANCNGIIDPTELPASNILVELFNVNNTSTPVAITTTDASGNYIFNNVPTGTYYETFILPNGYQYTKLGGNSNIVPSTGTSQVITINGINTNTIVNAGLCKLLKIAGQTFFDCSMDGIYDYQDKLLCGITVLLYDSTGNLINRQITDCDGYYQFKNLSAGNYILQFVPRAGLSFTTQVTTDYYGSKPAVSNGLAVVALGNQDYLQGYAGFLGEILGETC